MGLAAQREKFLSPEEYLERERKALEKSEYRNGVLYAMSGASIPHNLLVSNLIFLLMGQLKEKPCHVYPSDMKVRVDVSRLYTYPDVTIVCGEKQFADDEKDVLLNPTVLFEVLSSSTESYDRGKKSEQYRTLDSLQEYCLVSQDRMHVEKYKKEGRFWTLTEESQPDKTISLESVSCSLPLSELYHKVEFPKEEEE